MVMMALMNSREISGSMQPVSIGFEFDTDTVMELKRCSVNTASQKINTFQRMGGEDVMPRAKTKM